MPTVDGVKISKAIEEQWRRELENADDALLLVFAKSHPHLVKGARLTASGIPLIRKRLISRATAKGEMDEVVRDLIATCGLNMDLIAVLSEEALELGFEPLARIYGYERFVAAMLVDHREGVREQAIDILTQDDAPAELGLPEALQAAERVFGRFLAALNEWTAVYDRDELDAQAAEQQNSEEEEDAPLLVMPPRGLTREVEELKAQLTEAKQRRAGEKALQKKIDKLQTTIETLESRRDALSTELAERTADVRSLKEELGQAGKRHEELRQEIESRVSARVDEELSSVKRSWFRDARELDAAWRKCRHDIDDALVASETALARQAEADRHSGNLREIRERLGRLRAAREALRQAGTDALSPLPEIAAAAEKVAKEVRSLEALLPASTPPGAALVGELELRIVTAQSAEELGRLTGLLDELVEQKLLSRSDARAVYVKLNHAMGKRYDRFMPKVIAGPTESSTDPVCLLRAAIAGKAPVILLVDGHNVLFGLVDRFEGSFSKKGAPGAAARGALLAQLRPFVTSPSTCDVRLYFDGPTRSETRHSVNLTEIYSGGGDSDQRADRVIVEYLRYCVQNCSATARILVTDDRELARQAKSHGAQALSATRFDALLEEVSP